jgi:hypothetical protein
MNKKTLPGFKFKVLKVIGLDSGTLDSLNPIKGEKWWKGF